MKKIIIVSILLFQLLAIISCRVSDTIQNSEKKSTLSTHSFPTLAPPTSIPTNTATPTETATPTSTKPLPTPTEHGVVDPKGIIPAGMPVIQDGYVMVVDPSGLLIDGDFIGFRIQVRVLGDSSRLFRYNASTLRLKDNLGNQYDYYYTIGYSRKCTESDLYLAKQIMIEPKTEIIIKPESGMMYTSYFWWCLDGQDKAIPGFIGNIPPEADSMILEFEGFGPFSGFVYKFDL
jgi:hypothetical protein